MGEAVIETGIRWWMRYVVVPLIAGGGLMALAVGIVDKVKPFEPTKTVAPASGEPQTPGAITANTSKKTISKNINKSQPIKDATPTSQAQNAAIPDSLKDRIDRVIFNLSSDSRGLVKRGDPAFQPYEKIIVSWDASAVSGYGPVWLNWGFTGENEDSWHNASPNVKGRQELVCGTADHKLTFVLNLQLTPNNVLRLGKIDTECLGNKK
jgi:hypothetical protein